MFYTLPDISTYVIQKYVPLLIANIFFLFLCLGINGLTTFCYVDVYFVPCGKFSVGPKKHVYTLGEGSNTSLMKTIMCPNVILKKAIDEI